MNTHSSSHAFLSSIELHQDSRGTDINASRSEIEKARNQQSKDPVGEPQQRGLLPTHSTHPSHSNASTQRQAGVALRALSHRRSPARFRPSSSTTPSPVLGAAQAQASIDFLLNISLSSPSSPPFRPSPSRPSGPDATELSMSLASHSSRLVSPSRESLQRTKLAEQAPQHSGAAGPVSRQNSQRPAGFARSVDFLSSISLGASPPNHGRDSAAHHPALPVGASDAAAGQPGSGARRRASTPPVSSRATPSPVRPLQGLAAAGLGFGDDLSPLAAAAAPATADAAWGGMQRGGRAAVVGSGGASAAGGRGRGGAEREREEEAGSGAQWARLLLDNLALAAWPLAQSPPESPT